MRRHGILLSGLLGLTAFCSGQASSEVQFEGSLRAPVYEAGYVLNWTDMADNQVAVYGLETSPIYSFPEHGVGSARYFVWAIDVDRAVARAYYIQPYQGEIDLLDTSGKIARTISTGSYIPQRLAFAPDHTIWAVGFVSRYESRGEDFNVLRHYDRTGKELGEAVPWSAISGGNNAYTALQLIVGGRFLFTGSDRIGFVSLANGGKKKWIEVSFSGNLLGQYDLGSLAGLSFLPGAMTPSGRVYGRIYDFGAFTR